MGALVFIGLGLHDEKGISLRGLEAARTCDVVFAEFYTSTLVGVEPKALEALLDKSIRVLSREEVESGETVLAAARERRVAFLVPGDPMAATTHVDMRLRAAALSIPTEIVHGVSVLTAVAGSLGLQAYKFGRTTTIPRPTPGFRPSSPLEAILENRHAGLHSLVLLDVAGDGTFLTAHDALRLLLDLARETRSDAIAPWTLACVVSRVGSPDGRATAARIGDLLTRDIGPSPHSIVIPGKLHFLEREALVVFAGAPQDL